ncbi:hypothetical protein CLIM01_07533 [Colletotrichum limetticola]|uniref:Uncharacterized protein n=1 Tax=Colletotrichum limetticola TaxID=1209924 RepID=A0ABQ9PU91_9PEZI|nr:hypothetical protein CLIM01_07533 [Colletotrichum limetticola]
MIILFLTGLFFAWFACAAQVPRLVTVNINKANMTMTATAIQSGAILGRQLRDPNICGYVANKPLACPNNGSCRTDKDGFIGCCDEKGQSCSIYTTCFPGPQKPTPANSGTLICPPPEATPSTSDKPPAPPPGSGIMQDLTNEQRVGMLYLWTVEREKYTKSANDGV